MKAIVLLFLLLSSFSAAAQTSRFEQQRDSLSKIVAASTGEEKLIAYRQLHFLYMDYLSDEASWNALTAFVDEYMKFAEKENNIKLQGDIRINYLIGALRANRFAEAEKKAPETLAFLKANGMTEGYFVAYKQFILVYCRRGLFDKALDELQKVYAEAGRQNDREAQFFMQYLMGMTYMYQDRLTEAEDYYRQSITTAEKMSKKPFGLIVAYQEVCNMLQTTNQFDEFFILIKQTETLLEQLEKENPKKSYTNEKNNIWTLYAFAYSSIKEYDRAEYYCNLMDSLYGKNAVSQGNTLSIRSSIAESRKQWDKAIDYVNRALEIDPNHLPLRLAKVRILAGAENAPLTWAEIETHVAFTDSMRNAAFNAQLDELRTQYEVDKHIFEKERNRNYFVFALGGVALLLILVVVIFINRQKIHKKNVALVQQILEQPAANVEAGSALPSQPDETDALFLALENYMQTETPFIESSFNRETISQKLSTNVEYLRQIIRKNANCTIGNYILHYRLRFSRNLLLRPAKEYTIEAVALDSGFGSRNTFHELFRKTYGLTPAEFRKIAMEEAAQ
jgi:AraC-like DNA-binding protein